MNKSSTMYNGPSLARNPMSIALLCMAPMSAPLATADSGTIAFDANITLPTCNVTGENGATGAGDTIQVHNMDSAIGVLGDGGTWGNHGKRFDLRVTCPGNMSSYTLARASFQPGSGSGLDPQDNQLLRLVAGSTARHVALALWRADISMIDPSRSPTVTVPLVVSGDTTTALIALGAIFTRTSPAPVAGIATASLPFTLTYE
jgi:major type 1 subunit fimbrin (pilin)